MARWVAPWLFPDLDPGDIESVAESSLDFPVPLLEIEPGIWVLELFHGPTLAFKDVGARFMAALMEKVSRGATEGGWTNRTVLVATSGDTGGAVASAFHGRRGYRVVVLFPGDAISERQRRQMTTLGGNVTAVAVAGTFDDCQRLVKEAFLDEALSEEHGLTSANSINVGRWLPQTLYYFHAARLLPEAHFVVPAGNLGNLCAGLLAWRCGMPAEGLTAATNENRAFVEYLDGAPFEARPSIRTSSNAMDVGDPSNLERVRWLFGDDAGVRANVHGHAVSDADVVRCIGDLHRRTGYIADPHTAVAYVAATRDTEAAGKPVVVLATAHPAKFPKTVEHAIGQPVDVPAALRALDDLDESMRSIPPHLSALSGILADPSTRFEPS